MLQSTIAFALSLLMIVVLPGCAWLTPDPPKPEITYAEFPFEVVYELDGETVTVNDIYVCEFDGFGWNEAVGKHREWKGYIKSTGAKELVLHDNGDLKFAVSVGSPEYYMDDPDCAYSENVPKIYYIKQHASGGISSGLFDEEKMLQQYKLKLVSWTFSKPIQNSFA